MVNAFVHYVSVCSVNLNIIEVSWLIMLNYCGFDGKQEQSDLMREIEAELKRSKDELDKSHVDVSLHNFPFLQ